MRYLCFVLVVTGAMILAWSTLRYYRVFVYMRSQTYEHRTFHSKIYSVSYLMMLFFLVGYIYVAFTLIIGTITFDFLPVSLIFFFGAIFVMCMVNVQKIMAKTICKQISETIQSMIDAIEAKDFYTKGHSEHVLRLSELLYEFMPGDAKSKIDPIKLKDAAMLHDIGKIGIPDGILNKPGKLTVEEYEIIKQHPKNGKSILEKTVYHEICDMILYHHERIDGKGYYNMPADAVPIEAKIIAVADTFSALYTDRVYRKRFRFGEAIAFLRESAGTQLDAALVEVFCSIPEKKIKKASVSTAL